METIPDLPSGALLDYHLPRPEPKTVLWHQFSNSRTPGEERRMALEYSEQTVNVIQRLRLAQLVPGQTSRFWLQLISDGLGNPVLVPIMVARGKRDGPAVGVTATIHGDELNGLPVIHRIFRELEVKNLRGTVIGVPVANVPSFLTGMRRFPDAYDLNRAMPGKELGQDSDAYAFRLMDRLVSQFDILIDLHTASFGRINSFYIRADMTRPETAELARLQNGEIIVHGEGEEGTLRLAAAQRGIRALTVELGDPNLFQAERIEQALVGLRNTLAHLDMVDVDIQAPETPPVECERSYWLYTSCGGILEVFPDLTDFVRQGERIGRIRNVFGDVIQDLIAPQAGVVVGKSTQPVNRTGGRILHLGIVDASH